MSGVGEAIGIVSCVAGIISALHNGSAMIRRMKEDRAARQALQPPQLLEISVNEAIEEIEREETKVVRRFGEEEFNRGDRDALVELQEIIILLQDNFIERLLQGGSGNEETDFTPLIAVVEAGRDHTITALMGLRQRMLRNAGVETISSLASIRPPPQDATKPKRRSVAVPPLISTSEDVVRARKDSAASATPQSQRKSSDSATTSSQISRDVTSRGTIASRNLLDLEHFTGSRTTVNSRIGSLLEPAPQAEPRESSSSSERPDAEYNAIPQPTKANDYLGFCKTAAKLQNGERPITVARNYLAYTTQSSVSAAVCREINCAFRQICDGEQIWKHVYKDQAKGLKYRWSFLAKSHVPAKVFPPTVKQPYLYQCMFCTYSGYAKNHFSEEAYLDHISLEHRGTTINSVVLYKTFCISDHECKDSEDFDINLFPLRTHEQNERRRLKMRDSFMHGPTLMDDLRGYMSSRLSLATNAPAVSENNDHEGAEMSGALLASEAHQSVIFTPETVSASERTLPNKNVSRGNMLAAEAARYHEFDSKESSARRDKWSSRSHTPRERQSKT